MTKITSGLLNDTLNLIQLARETALRSGRQAQASRFAPVEQNLQKAVTTARENRVAAPSQSGMMGQKGFQNPVEFEPERRLSSGIQHANR